MNRETRTISRQEGERRYTAREWLERTLPTGGGWRQLPLNQFCWHSTHPLAWNQGVLFSNLGAVIGSCGPTGPNSIFRQKPVSRSEAIDLMAKAIEAGESVQAGGVPDHQPGLPDPVECCRDWATDDMTADLLGNGHHHNCRHYKANVGAVGLITKLVEGIEEWAAQEDGIPDWLWDAYSRAVFITTEKVLAKAGDGKPCETCNGRGKVPSGVYEQPPEPCPTCSIEAGDQSGERTEMVESKGDFNIDEVVYWEITPRDYSTIAPYTATIRHPESKPLTIAEKSIIQSALVNAAVRIKQMRGVPELDNFYRIGDTSKASAQPVIVDDNDGSPMVADPQPAKASGYHDVDEFYRDDQPTKPIDPPLISIQDVQALHDQTSKINRDIDPHEFELVKAIATGVGRSHSSHRQEKEIVGFARRLLAEMRGGIQ